MNATLEQQRETALALLSSMLTSLLQGYPQVTNCIPAQSSSALNTLLAKPTASTETRASKRDVFEIDVDDLDLSPSSESEDSSDDDRPIRNTRHLKSEVRRLKAMIRRANRRTARRAARIAKHLDASQAAAVFDSLGASVTPLWAPQLVIEDAPDKSMIETVLLEDACAEASDPAPLHTEAINTPVTTPPISTPYSPPTSTPSSDILAEETSWLCKPCNTSFTHLDAYHNHKQTNTYHKNNVATYKHLRPTYTEEEVSAAQVTHKAPSGFYCPACDFRTGTHDTYKRHLRRQVHARNVSRRLRYGPGAKKEVDNTPAEKPGHYCEACKHFYAAQNWSRHLKGSVHASNVANNMCDSERSVLLTPPGEGEEGVRGMEQRERWCGACEMYPGVRWARHVASPGHVFNAIRFERLRVGSTEEGDGDGDGDGDVMDGDTTEEEDGMEDESVMEEDSLLMGGEEVSSSPSSSTSPSPSPSSCSSVIELIKKAHVVVQERTKELQEEHEEPEHYCDDCDYTASGTAWHHHLTSDAHVENVETNMQRDGIQYDEEEGDEDMQIFSDALASSSLPISIPSVYPEYYTGGTSSPPFLPWAPSRPSGQQDWYCDICDANVAVSGPWTIGVHMAKHQQELYKDWNM